MSKKESTITRKAEAEAKESTPLQDAQKAYEAACKAAEILKSVDASKASEIVSTAQAVLDKASAQAQEKEIQAKAKAEIEALRKEAENASPEVKALVEDVIAKRMASLDGVSAFAQIHEAWRYSSKGNAKAFNEAMLNSLRSGKPFSWTDAEGFRHGSAITQHVSACNSRLKAANLPFRIQLSAHNPLAIQPR